MLLCGRAVNFHSNARLQATVMVMCESQLLHMSLASSSIHMSGCRANSSGQTADECCVLEADLFPSAGCYRDGGATWPGEAQLPAFGRTLAFVDWSRLIIITQLLSPSMPTVNGLAVPECSCSSRRHHPVELIAAYHGPVA